MQTHFYKLRLNGDLSLEELTNRVANGARFIAFQYCVSILFAVTQRRFSPAFLIEGDSQVNRIKWRYNLYTILFGWWGFPWGPTISIRSLKVNRKGGVDVTDDIMLNISEASLKARRVELKITNQWFCKPDKYDLGSFRRAFVRKFENDYYIRKIVVGYYINTGEGQAPYYVIGIGVREDFAGQTEKVREALFTQFRKSGHYEFVNLSEPTEFSTLLEKQGETVI
jgi:hypothetical protein